MNTSSNLESKGGNLQPRNPWNRLFRQPARALLVICALVLAAISSQAANIVFVSFHGAEGTPTTAAANAGFTNAPDAAYTRLLRAAGHNVTRIVTIENADTSAALLAQINAADLVIISRSVPSGHYQQNNETAFWNGITKPTMILGAYIIRGATANTRLGYMAGDTIPDVSSNPMRLTVANPSHPIFAGISVDSGNLRSEERR